MIQKAIILSKKIHKNQIRKFNGSPYFVHPERVANIIKENKESKHINELISAAYLHDSIEDGDISYEYLKQEFGYMVASLVLEVTNDDALLNEYGKNEYMKNKALILTNYALVLKLADRLDNISDLDLASKDFREKYSNDTKYLIKILTDFRKLTNTQIKLLSQIEEKLKKY